MGPFDRINQANQVTEDASTSQRLAFMTEQLEAASSTIDMLSESMADLELAREDVGWTMLGFWSKQQMTRQGLNQSAELCRVMAMSDPLIKRGLALRHAYTFGNGFEIEANDRKATDLVKLVQAYIERNADTFFGPEAVEELERANGTDGNLFIAHFTKPHTGSVKTRSIPFAEISERICNPDDRDEPWFYKRVWISDDLQSNGTMARAVQHTAYYPDLRHRPRVRVKSIDGHPVMWDAPVLHMKVNRLDGQDWGLGDAFASIDWARGYSTYLNDWAKLMKALAKFAWMITGDKAGTARNAAAEVRKNNAATGAAVRPPNASDAGQTAAMAGAKLEAVPKSGATLDAESGRPLAAMTAAGLGVPVTMLLADPGQTGARAVAETLDKPTALEFQTRQRVWQRAFMASIDYQILQSVKAPAGPLRGTITRDEWDTEGYVLAGDVDPTVNVTFGSIDDVDPKSLLEAVAIADGLEKVPDLVILRAALMALPGVEDVDDILDKVTDEDGNFVPPTLSAAQVAIDRFNRGEDTGTRSRSAADAPEPAPADA